MVGPDTYRQVSAGGPELAESVGAVADGWYPEGLQGLDGAGHVQDGLRSGADHGHRDGGKCCQVRGDVAVVAPVHSADSAGGEHRDPRAVGREHCGGHRGRPGRPPGQNLAYVPEADLDHTIGRR